MEKRGFNPIKPKATLEQEINSSFSNLCFETDVIEKARNSVLYFFNEFKFYADDVLAVKASEIKKMAKKLVDSGKNVDELLPEAYGLAMAVMQRTKDKTESWNVLKDRKTWNMVPYHEQIDAAIAMHYGMIVDMKTGEGKSLAAVLPLYLNALGGKKSYLLTVNDYLAKRDAQQMAPIFSKLGLKAAFNPNIASFNGAKTNDEKLKVITSNLSYLEKKDPNTLLNIINAIGMQSCIQQEGSNFKVNYDIISRSMNGEQLEAAYGISVDNQVSREKAKNYEKADVIYSSSSEIAFDFLKKNTAIRQGHIASSLKSLDFIVLDEVDQIVLDNGQNPHIIELDRSISEDSKSMDDEEKKLYKRITSKVRGMTGLKITENSLNVYKGGKLERTFTIQNIMGAYKGNIGRCEKILEELRKDRKGNEKRIAAYEKGLNALNKKLDNFKGKSSYQVLHDFITKEYGENNFDFIVDSRAEENEQHFTERGLRKLEKKLHIRDFFSEGNYSGVFERNVHAYSIATKVLEAFTMQRGVDYACVKGQILCRDRLTGRIQPGHKFQGGLHDALALKHGYDFEISKAAAASVDIQDLLINWTGKFSGMSGSVVAARDEFKSMFGKEIYEIKAHRQTKQDLDEIIFNSKKEMYRNAIDEIKNAKEKGQPVLVSVLNENEYKIMHDLMKKEGIKFNGFHGLRSYVDQGKGQGYYDFDIEESKIIGNAGKAGTITLATNISARGVHIELDEKAEKAGGLYIMGISKSPNSLRVDVQRAGRSGRQGKPGKAAFFLSLEDDVVNRYVPLEIVNKWKKQLKEKPHTRYFGGFDEFINSRFEIKPYIVDFDAKERIKTAINAFQDKQDAASRENRESKIKRMRIVYDQRKEYYGIRDTIKDSFDQLKRYVVLAKELEKKKEKPYSPTYLKHLVGAAFSRTELSERFDGLIESLIGCYPTGSASNVKDADKAKNDSISYLKRMYYHSQKFNPESENDRDKLRVEFISALFGNLWSYDKQWMEHYERMEDEIKANSFKSSGAKSKEEAELLFGKEADKSYREIIQNVAKDVVDKCIGMDKMRMDLLNQKKESIERLESLKNQGKIVKDGNTTYAQTESGLYLPLRMVLK